GTVSSGFTEIDGVDTATNAVAFGTTGTAEIADLDLASDGIANLTITFANSTIKDGAAEQLLVEGTTSSIALNTTASASNLTTAISSITWSVAVTRTGDASTGTTSVVFTNSSSPTEVTTAQAEALLDAIKYNNTSDTPTAGARTFQVTVSDGTAISSAATKSITVTAENDTPVISVVNVAGAITEGTTLSDSGSITFADLDLTDLPVASEATLSVSALKADETTVLTLTAAQLTDIEDAFSISNVDGNDNDGTVTWSYNIAETALDFLAKDEVVTAVFTITVDDGNGGTDTEDVTITLTGSNDAPVITQDTGDSIAAAITEADIALEADGTLSVEDLDTTNSVAVSVVSVAASQLDGSDDAMTSDSSQPDNEALLAMLTATTDPIDGTVTTGDIAWAFNSGSEAFNYLAAGEKLVLTYTLTASDGTASDDQTVTITITGTNDAPVITQENGDSIAAAITEGTTLSDSGSITFADLDLTDSPVASEATLSVSALKAGGTTDLTLTAAQQADIEAAFSITNVATNTNNGEVTWSYSIAEAALDFLAKDEVVTAVFTITVNDAKGGTDTEDVTITLTGTNDAPTVSSAITSAKAEGDASYQIDL
ncbi:hypothetical protein EKD02_09775, partial [Chlorobium phaeovibrioides]